MEEATKNTLTKVFNWFAYVIAPFVIIGYAYNEAPISAIIDNNAWFLVCLFVAGLCNGVMDVLQFHFNSSIFKILPQKFWNPEISWKNKYKDCDPLKGRKKWFGLIPVPVVLTDAWHMYKGYMTFFICCSVVFYKPITERPLLDFMIIYMVYKWCFNIVYRIISPKR